MNNDCKKYLTAASDYPIAEDDWVEMDTVSNKVRSAWRQWLNAPRFRVYEADADSYELVIPLFVPVSNYGHGLCMANGMAPIYRDAFQGLVVNRDTDVVWKVLIRPVYRDENYNPESQGQFVIILSGGDLYTKHDLLRCSYLEKARSMSRLIQDNYLYEGIDFARIFMGEAISILEYAVKHTMLPEEMACVIKEAVMARESRLHASIYDVLYSSLSMKVLSIINQSGITESAINYNWLVKSYSAKSDRRLAVLVSHELLVGHILRSEFKVGEIVRNDFIDDKQVSVLDVGDKGGDIIPVLSRWYGISEESVVRFGAVKCSWFYGLLKNDCVENQLPGLIRWLAYVTEECWPRTKDEWMCCYIIIAGLGRYTAQYDCSEQHDFGMEEMLEDRHAVIKYMVSVSQKGWLPALCGLLRQNLEGIEYKDFHNSEQHFCKMMLAMY